jgi:hypothetical protein
MSSHLGILPSHPACIYRTFIANLGSHTYPNKHSPTNTSNRVHICSTSNRPRSVRPQSPRISLRPPAKHFHTSALSHGPPARVAREPSLPIHTAQSDVPTSQASGLSLPSSQCMYLYMLGFEVLDALVRTARTHNSPAASRRPSGATFCKLQRQSA